MFYCRDVEFNVVIAKLQVVALSGLLQDFLTAKTYHCAALQHKEIDVKTLGFLQKPLVFSQDFAKPLVFLPLFQLGCCELPHETLFQRGLHTTPCNPPHSIIEGDFFVQV